MLDAVVTTNAVAHGTKMNVSAIRVRIETADAAVASMPARIPG
jgi:hypothetical protein